MQRVRIKATGIVQGVGFRPYVYRCAKRWQLTGWVRNQSDGVQIEVQGQQVQEFLQTFHEDLPSNAKLTDFFTEQTELVIDEESFEILTSSQVDGSTELPADLTTCDDCLAELFDPNSLYYLYPFLNCSHCGPRYSIVDALPYDRQQTSMAEFPLCTQCRQVYENPLDRRYHAQPTACAECGPAYSHDLAEVASVIKQGGVVAIKALGGYQFISDANNQQAISRLRKLKQRKTKPFGLMQLNLASVKEAYLLDEDQQTILLSKPRPIVLLDLKQSQQLSTTIAPGLSQHGVMLPSTPMHYLLFYHLLNQPEDKTWLTAINSITLVVTSANDLDQPLLADDTEAEQQLVTKVDLLVSHNRKIINRVDDSVIKFINQQPTFIRRARGYVPNTIQLKAKQPETLALGAYLKNTICFTKLDKAYVSQHLGNIDNQASLGFLLQTLENLQRLFSINPEIIVHDAHPDYYTTNLATEFGLPTIAVQHHHAHAAAVMAEYQLNEPVLAWVLDGYGYGADHSAWGGELLLLEGTEAIRLQHLKPLAMPGGDKAAKQPWRMAASVLQQLGKTELITHCFPDQPQADALMQWLFTNPQLPMTSSCGRLFDAAAALLSVCAVNHYEAEAAMRLEALVNDLQVAQDGWLVTEHGIDFLPLFKQLLTCDQVSGANLFHSTLAAALAEQAVKQAKVYGINKLILAGGCCLNKTLVELMIKFLNKVQLTVYFPRKLPSNDGSISLGQAWVVGQQ